MYRVRIPGKIRPKLSSIPRCNTEANIYLNVYKMSVEKERLQRELTNIESRRNQIKERIKLLNQQTLIALKKAEKSQPTQPISKIQSAEEEKEQFTHFQTMTLEY